MEGSPNGMALVLKTSVRKDLQVRILYPPPRNKFFKKKNLNVAVAFKSKIYYATPVFFYTYILRSLKDNSFYIGHTADLRKRIKKHNSGENSATKPYTPYKLIFYEAFLNRIDAKNREEYLKGGYGRRTIKALLNRYLKNISNPMGR